MIKLTYSGCAAGISKVKDPSKSYLNATNDTGTPMYMAPEQFNGTRVDEKVWHCTAVFSDKKYRNTGNCYKLCRSQTHIGLGNTKYVNLDI